MNLEENFDKSLPYIEIIFINLEIKEVNKNNFLKFDWKVNRLWYSINL